MIGLIGKKLGMSQLFQDDGKVTPVCVIEAGPCPVVQVKTKATDGYDAIQVGFGARKRVTKAIAGHLKKSGAKSVSRLAEFRVKKIDQYQVGAKLDAGLFAEKDVVKVTGITKGRGFSGGMKRWGWHGQPMTHGSMSHRRIGSAGGGHADRGHPPKGKTMPGHYGTEKVTIRNLRVVKVDKDKNLVYLSGAVPGYRNSLVLIIKEE